MLGFAGLIADLDDAGLPELEAHVLLDTVPTRTLGSHRVDEGIIGLRRNLEPLARPHFFQGVAHRLRSNPQSGKIAVRVYSLHVGGNRLLD